MAVAVGVAVAALVAAWRKLVPGGASGCSEAALRQRIVDVARAEVGKRRLDVYFADAAPEYVGQEPEWCGIFALWCLRQAGVLREKRWKVGLGFTETAPPLPRTLNPQPADIAYFSTYQHHAVVLANLGDGTVELANGNGAGGVVSLGRKAISEAAAFYSVGDAVRAAVAKGCPQ